MSSTSDESYKFEQKDASYSPSYHCDNDNDDYYSYYYYYEDSPDDYDDFCLNNRNSNTAVHLSKKRQQSRREGGKGSIYSSKHIRAKQKLQQKKYTNINNTLLIFF